MMLTTYQPYNTTLFLFSSALNNKKKKDWLQDNRGSYNKYERQITNEMWSKVTATSSFDLCVLVIPVQVLPMCIMLLNFRTKYCFEAKSFMHFLQ
jgi:hypothetical protein